jgi:hypothetical protein
VIWLLQRVLRNGARRQTKGYSGGENHRGEKGDESNGRGSLLGKVNYWHRLALLYLFVGVAHMEGKHVKNSHAVR